jgi:transcriptional regulator with XRE-family HTH domain
VGDDRDIDDALAEHLEKATDDDVAQRLDDASRCIEIAASDDCELEGQLVLLPTVRRRLRLRAYLASALSGLDETERQLIFALSDVVAQVCAQHEIELYEPRKNTDPVHHSDVADTDVWVLDKQRVLQSDLVIHLAHHPSTGSGEELAYAEGSLIPILLISHARTRVSRMVTGIPAIKIHLRYTEPEQLREELGRRLLEIRPLLEQRRLALGEDQNVVGEKVRQLRESLGLTREEVAAAAGTDAADLAHLEESPDRVANWTLTKLRVIATVLRTTVSDLIEPDLGEQLAATIDDWIHGREAARFPGMSPKDQRRLVYTLLGRLRDEFDPAKDVDQ